MTRYLVMAKDGVTVANVIVVDPQNVKALRATGMNLVEDAGKIPVSPGDQVAMSKAGLAVTKARAPESATILVGGETYELVPSGGDFVLRKKT